MLWARPFFLSNQLHQGSRGVPENGFWAGKSQLNELFNGFFPTAWGRTLGQVGRRGGRAGPLSREPRQPIPHLNHPITRVVSVPQSRVALIEDVPGGCAGHSGPEARYYPYSQLKYVVVAPRLFVGA